MKYAIGLDIGATKIRGIVADSDGKIFFPREIETKPERKRAEILNDIINVVIFLKKYAEKKNLKLAGIGIGAPGIIKKGKFIFGGGTLFQFKGFNIEGYIKKETGLKTLSDNDSELFTLAESFFGAGKNYSRVAGIIWGTGIGSGFVDKKAGKAIPLEIGHLIIEPNIKNEPKCGCGARGCVENLASGKNIIRRYCAKGGKIKKAGVKEIYHSKEKAAKESLEDAYKYLGMAVAVLIRAIKPEIIIIGGGVSNLPAAARKKLRKYVAKCLVKTPTKKFPPKAYQPRAEKIVKSKIGEFAGALGAASLVFGK